MDNLLGKMFYAFITNLTAMRVNLQIFMAVGSTWNAPTLIVHARNELYMLKCKGCILMQCNKSNGNLTVITVCYYLFERCDEQVN